MHQIEYLTYSGSRSQQYISDECNAFAEKYSDSGKKLYNPIRFIDRVFDTYEEARNYIDTIDNGDYDQIAVKFKEAEKFVSSSALLKLKERSESANKEYLDLDDRQYYSPDTVKSKFITCKKCGSKLAVSYLKRVIGRSANQCPVCWNDLRPQSVLERIAKLKEKGETLSKACRERELEERKKTNRNAPEQWLVKIEIHV